MSTTKVKTTQKEFRQLLGNRVYLEMPEESKTLIHLDKATKAAKEEEMLRKLGRLKVYAVGSAIDFIKEGDEIMLDPSSAGRACKIPLSKDKEVLLVSIFDIAHIW